MSIKKVKKIQKKRKSIYFWLLLLLCGVLFLSHTLYVLYTHQDPQQDEHIYLDFALKFYDVIRSPSLSALRQIIETNPYRQPLYGLFLSLPLLFVGTAYMYKTALWFNIVFYLTTIIATYFLAKEFLTRRSSFLSAMIFSFYGFPLFYLHYAYSETAATSFVVLALLFLVRSKFFMERRNTILFAIFFTIGLFTRWVFAIFIAGPLLLSLLVTIDIYRKNDKKQRKNIIANGAYFVGMGMLPAMLLYYLPRFSSLSDYFLSQAKHSPKWVTQLSSLPPGLENTFSVHSVMFYFNILSQQTVFFFALFGIGTLLAMRFVKKYAFLLAGFFVAYATFTFVSVWKGDRFIVPIYPLMAIISAITFDHIRNKWVRRSLVILAVIIGSFNFLGSSWGVGPMGHQGLKDIVLPSFIRHPRRIYLTSIVWPPTKQELNAECMVKIIEKDFPMKSRKPSILLLYEYHPYSNALYTITVYEKRSQFDFTSLRDSDYIRFFTLLEQADYLLIKDRKPLDTYFSQQNSPELYKATRITREFNNMFQQNQGALPFPFTRFKTLPIPLDGTNMMLYKRTGKINTQQWQEFVELLIQANPESKQEIQKASQMFFF